MLGRLSQSELDNFAARPRQSSIACLPSKQQVGGSSPSGQTSIVVQFQTECPISEAAAMTTPEQRAKLETLIAELRSVAGPVGPLHSFWDPISDMEAFLAGRRTMLQKSADEWITFATTLARNTV